LNISTEMEVDLYMRQTPFCFTATTLTTSFVFVRRSVSPLPYNIDLVLVVHSLIMVDTCLPEMSRLIDH